MLKTLKSFFIASCYFFLLFSCGKEVENSSNETNDPNQVVILPGDSGLKTLQVDFNPSVAPIAEASMQAKSSGWLRIPSAPKVLEGDATIINTRLYINQVEESIESELSLLYCEFQSIKMISSGDDNALDLRYNHYFKGCFEDVDGDGKADEINFIPGDEVAVQKGKHIKISVKSDSNASSLVLKSDFEVDYL